MRTQHRGWRRSGASQTSQQTTWSVAQEVVAAASPLLYHPPTLPIRTQSGGSSVPPRTRTTPRHIHQACSERWLELVNRLGAQLDIMDTTSGEVVHEAIDLHWRLVQRSAPRQVHRDEKVAPDHTHTTRRANSHSPSPNDITGPHHTRRASWRRTCLTPLWPPSAKHCSWWAGRERRRRPDQSAPTWQKAWLAVASCGGSCGWFSSCSKRCHRCVEGWGVVGGRGGLGREGRW